MTAPLGPISFTSASRVLGERELALLSTLTWSTSELHTNQAAAAAGPFAERLLPGPGVVAIVVAAARVELEQELARRNLVLGAMTSIEVRYLAPIVVGASITVRSTLVPIEEHSSDRPMVTIQDDAVLADDTPALTITRRHVVTAHLPKGEAR